VTPRPKLSLLALASLGLVGTACQLPPFLPEFQVNTSDPGYNFSQDVAMRDGGDFIVTWSESTTDLEVFGRGFAASTTPYSDPFLMNDNTAPQRVRSSIAHDAEGRFVIVWSEEGGGVWGQRWDSDGSPLGENFEINTSTESVAVFPHVASDPSGNFVVTWWSGPSPNVEAVARRFDSNGAPLGDEFSVNVFTTGDQIPRGIAMSPSGFVVTWFGEGVGGDGVFGRLFDASGAPITGDFQINTATIVGDYLQPDVAMNAAGDFVVVWGDTVGLYSAVMGRRYDSAGASAGDVFPISGTGLAAGEPKVASDSAGNFVVTWTSAPVFLEGGGTGDPSAVRARLYDIGGFPVSVEFVVNEITTALQFRGRPSLARDGSFVVAWSSGTTYQYDVKGRKSGVRAAPAITVDPPLEVGSEGVGGSNHNRVFEPGETVIVRAAWANDTAADVLSVSGSSPLFTGPPGAGYTLDDDTAGYDTVPAGQTKSCAVSGDCYLVTVSDPPTRPEPHWDALLQETLNLSLPHTWVLHIGESFPDVLTDHQFYAFIETLFHHGITGGCVGGYCPADPVTRAQMAVFLLKAKFGSAHIPPPCTGTVFTDVPCTGGAFDPWIEELAALQITGGCGPNLYCPNNTVTRQQMAVFLLKALEGSAYDPPDCADIFDDVPCTPGTGFSDWIEELFNRGITGGCSMAPPLYCPTNPNNRGQMAVFLVKTFGLVLYGG
jgi:hypothetical protein